MHCAVSGYAHFALPRGPESFRDAGAATPNLGDLRENRMSISNAHGRHSLAGCRGRHPAQRCMPKLAQTGAGGRSPALGLHGSRLTTSFKSIVLACASPKWHSVRRMLRDLLLPRNLNVWTPVPLSRHGCASKAWFIALLWRRPVDRLRSGKRLRVGRGALVDPPNRDAIQPGRRRRGPHSSIARRCDQ